MDARILFLSSIMFIFGEGITSGAGDQGEVRIFLLLDASSQGTIEGEAPLPKEPKTIAIEVVEVRDRVYTPLDSGTGMPTGQRRYEGVVIRKPVDKATPQIATVLANNEAINEAQLHIYMEAPSSGSLQHRFTYTLEDAVLTNIERRFIGLPLGSPDEVLRPEEEITIRFQSISILDVVNGTQFDDTVSTGGGADVPLSAESDGEQEKVAQIRDDATATVTP